MDGTQPTAPEGKFPKKLLIIGGLVAVLVLIAGAVWWMFFKDDKAISPELDKSLSAANEKQTTGDYEAVLKDLTAVEDQAKTKAEKVRLYSEIAAAASSAGKLDEALSYYAKKHEVDPTTKGSDGYVVGLIYERKDDPTKALEQYRLYLEYLKTRPTGTEVTAQIDNITEVIASLEASQP